ncbi:hypothetical protein [Mesorhizobium onobrychidis]|uniref:hypothetical protein n=1 Tax=Mesorhizobium onobrychidis TaxID=2775404 RepID=UPI00215796B2|nr:hypothetical protein [Mesorhizobium onobrychidis]
MVELVVDQGTVQVLELLGRSRRQQDKAGGREGENQEFRFIRRENLPAGETGDVISAVLC